MEKEEIKIRKEEINEILSTPPHWLFRWGISLVFLTILLGLFLLYFIKYPDIISTKTNITSLNQIESNAISSISNNQLEAKFELPLSNIEKIKIGEQVNIKLDDFPFVEYGMVEGKVKSISSDSVNRAIIVCVELPNGLKTYFNKKVTYKTGMSGTAEIKTGSISLLDRILMKFQTQ